MSEEIEVPNNGPRVTPEDLEAMIVSEHYGTAADLCDIAYIKCGAEGRPRSLNLLTFCVLVLKNGFTVTGESACVSPENFDAQIGRDIARANAIEKLWPLMGFKLACDLQPTKE